MCSNDLCYNLSRLSHHVFVWCRGLGYLQTVSFVSRWMCSNALLIIVLVVGKIIDNSVPLRHIVTLVFVGFEY